MREQWQKSGEVWVKKRKIGGGRPKIITPAYEEEIRKFLDHNPEAFIKDIAQWLRVQCQLQVDETTVWRTVERRGWLKDRPRKPPGRDSQGMWVRSLPRDENGEPIRNWVEGMPLVANKDPPRKWRTSEAARKKRRTADERLLEDTREFVKEVMSNPKFDGSHDYGHVERVTNMAIYLLKCEQAAHPDVLYDPTLLQLAALMHDVEDHKYVTASGTGNEPGQQNGVIPSGNGAQNPPHTNYPPPPPGTIDTPNQQHNPAAPQSAAGATSYQTPNSQASQPMPASAPPTFPWPANIPPPTKRPQHQTPNPPPHPDPRTQLSLKCRPRISPPCNKTSLSLRPQFRQPNKRPLHTTSKLCIRPHTSLTSSSISSLKSPSLIPDLILKRSLKPSAHTPNSPFCRTRTGLMPWAGSALLALFPLEV